MSDPVKQSEIEDVLSSIRRLVSDDHRKPAADMDAAEVETPSRFVLTEALRVAEPLDPAPADGQGETSEPSAFRNNRPVLDEEQDASDIGETEAVDVIMPDEAADTDEPVMLQHDDIDLRPDTQYFEFSEGLKVNPTAEESAPEPDDDTIDEGEAPSLEDSDNAEPSSELPVDPAQSEWSADLSVALAEGAGHPAPEAPLGAHDLNENAPQDDVSDGRPWADPGATLYEAAGLADVQRTGDTEASTVKDPATFVRDHDTVDMDDAESVENDDDPRPLGDKIAALEKVIAQTQDQWEPDDPGMDDYAGTDVETLEWEDASADPVVDVEEQEDPSVAHTPPLDDTYAETSFATRRASLSDPEPDLLGEDAGLEDDVDNLAQEEAIASDEALLDEDALRDLIADIVREELQGALGERITRNVRKLVRREIQRALAVQDLE